MVDITPPEVGGSVGSWGSELNTALDTLASATTAVEDGLTAAAAEVSALDSAVESQGADVTTLQGAVTTLQNQVAAGWPWYVVASSTAGPLVKAKADYVCDGVADDVQIQAAITAAKAAGGGLVQLTYGQYNCAATLSFTGNADEDDADSVTLRGVGQQATTLKMAVDTNGVNLTKWCGVNVEH